MTKYRITSKAGIDFGVYDGETREEAFAAMVAEGHDGEDTDGRSTAGSPEDWLIEPVQLWEAWEDGRRSEAVQYYVPALDGNPVNLGAAALGVDVSDSLNVQLVG